MRIIVAFDPGLKGGIAILRRHDDNRLSLEAIPMPVLYDRAATRARKPPPELDVDDESDDAAPEKPKKRKSAARKGTLDLHAVVEILHGTADMLEALVLELVGPGPKGGRAGLFTFGRGFGQLEGAVFALKLPVIYTPPTVWKRRVGLDSADKDMARALASKVFPRCAADWKYVKLDGVAEASLIAYDEALARGWQFDGPVYRFEPAMLRPPSEFTDNHLARLFATAWSIANGRRPFPIAEDCVGEALRAIGSNASMPNWVYACPAFADRLPNGRYQDLVLPNPPFAPLPASRGTEAIVMLDPVVADEPLEKLRIDRKAAQVLGEALRDEMAVLDAQRAQRGTMRRGKRGRDIAAAA